MLRLWLSLCPKKGVHFGLNPNHNQASNTPQVLKKGVRFDLQIAADVPIIRRVPAAGPNDPHSGGLYPQYWPIIKCSQWSISTIVVSNQTFTEGNIRRVEHIVVIYHAVILITMSIWQYSPC